MTIIEVTEEELEAAETALDQAISGRTSLTSCVHAVLGAINDRRYPTGDNMTTTVRKARVEAARRAIVKVHQQAAICREEVHPYDLAVATVDALFTDHSMDHFTVLSPAEREEAEYLPGDDYDPVGGEHHE